MWVKLSPGIAIADPQRKRCGFPQARREDLRFDDTRPAGAVRDLRLFPERRRYDRGAVRVDAVASNYLQLSADQFRIIGEWYHLAILSLIRTKGFVSKPEWIAQRLGITEREATQAVERLKRLELIEISTRGVIRRTSASLRTSDDVAHLSIRRAHEQSLDLAKEALQKVPVGLRDFTSVTMPTSPKRLARAKELIRKFQDELSDILEDESDPNIPRDEVYQFCVQLFPLTKVSEPGERK